MAMHGWMGAKWSREGRIWPSLESEQLDPWDADGVAM